MRIGSDRFFWYGIIPARAPRVASAYPFCPQPNPFYNTPFFYGFDGIMRTRGCVPAMYSKQGRQNELVEAYGEYENFFEHQSIE